MVLFFYTEKKKRFIRSVEIFRYFFFFFLPRDTLTDTEFPPVDRYRRNGFFFPLTKNTPPDAPVDSFFVDEPLRKKIWVRTIPQRSARNPIGARVRGDRAGVRTARSSSRANFHFPHSFAFCRVLRTPPIVNYRYKNDIGIIDTAHGDSTRTLTTE